jgi:hypothetical protein
MKLDVTIDSGSKNATVLTREVHVSDDPPPLTVVV